MAYKITVDRAKCIGCGVCASECPVSFEMKGDKSHVKKTKIEKLTCERNAAEICPVSAISIKEVK